MLHFFSAGILRIYRLGLREERHFIVQEDTVVQPLQRIWLC